LIKLRFTLLLAILLSFAANATSLKILSASEKEYIINRDEVRVAIFDRTKHDANTSPMTGEFYTLNLNYLKRVANELGLKLKFVEFGRADEIAKALEMQKVDLAVGFQHKDLSPEPLLIYSKPFIESSVAYWSKSERTNLWDSSYRWVCVKGSIYCDILRRENALSVTQTETFDEAIKSVADDKNDAVLASYISLSEYLNKSDELQGIIHTPDWGGLVTAKIIANKQQARLIKIINKIIDLINQEAYIFTKNNPYLVTDMANIAYRVKNDNQNLIRYSCSDDAFPLLFRNSNGELTGYLYDLLALIESRTSLKFQYVPMADNETLTDMMSRGEIDLIPYSLTAMSPLESVEFTDTLISFRYYAVSLLDQPSEVAKADGVLLAQSKEELGVKEKVFGRDAILYSSPKGTLRALASGEIERAYIREDIIDMIISSHVDDEYFIDRKDFKTVNAVMAVSASKPMLTNLLNSVVRTWDGNELQKIKNSYDPFNVVYGIDYRLLLQLLLGLAGIIAIAGIVVYLWLKNLNLRFIIKENDARNSRVENKFLQSVIQQFPAQVFIHNEDDELLLSSCDMYLSGDCHNCSLRENNDTCTLLLTKEERKQVRETDQYVKRNIDVMGCALNMRTVEYICKRVSANDKHYVLTIINDITSKQRQERELVAAKQKAEQAISIRDKFLASMSHELRTPIAGMSGLLEILMARVTDEEGQMLLGNVSASARQLNVLVNDILDFSKLEAQQLKLEQRECEILSETGEVLRIHLAAAYEKGLKLNYQFTPTNVRVISFDSMRYAQIMNNLVSNAIKFTDQGEVQVQVDVDDDAIRLCVLDTGCGMSKEQQDIVFTPFIQADNSTARKYGGTGLGLSIVSELTELMGGSISLSSIQGLGTKVEVEVPHKVVSHYSNLFEDFFIECTSDSSDVASWLGFWTADSKVKEQRKHILIQDKDSLGSIENYEHVVELDPQLHGFKRIDGSIVTLVSKPFFPDLLLETLQVFKKPIERTQPQDPAGFSGKVLVAEDNPINQLVFRKQLTSLGFEVDIVGDGSTAYEKVKRCVKHYDLLITDCHMPVMDGFELVRKIREELPNSASLRIIGCTAEDSRAVHDRAESLGFDYMLYKPYGIERLRSAIDRLLTINDDKLQEQAVCDCWLDKFGEKEAVQMKQVFISTMTSDVDELMNSSIEPASLKKIAHKVKGGALILGIEQLSDIAKKVEQSAETVEPNELADLTQELIVCIKQHITLTEECERGSNECITP